MKGRQGQNVDGVVLDAIVNAIPAGVDEDFEGAVGGVDACGAEFHAAGGVRAGGRLIVPCLRCRVVHFHCTKIHEPPIFGPASHHLDTLLSFMANIFIVLTTNKP